MPCTRRLKAYRGREGGVVFSPRDGYVDQHMELACGQCMDCRLRRAREWAIRMVHEAKEYDGFDEEGNWKGGNAFLTLTYNEDQVPDDLSLDVRHWQLFAKKLRRRGVKFRYYHVGEYGDRFLRPHYHACIFGTDFPDKECFKVDNGFRLYTSKLVEECWSDENGDSRGFHLLGSLEFDSACYVARYVTKKMKAPEVTSLYTARCRYESEKRYTRVDPETGETWQVKPEYSTMSRRPGIGSRYFETYGEEVYDFDEVVMNGRSYPPPRYYDRLLAEKDGEKHERISAERRRNHLGSRTGDRDARDRDRETVLEARLNLNRRRA